MRQITFAIFLLAAVFSASCSGAAPASATCGQPGQWLDPADASAPPLAAGPLLEHMAGQQVVLLGETHDSAEDHRWQLQTLTELFTYQPHIAVAFEMFPRRMQPVLDQWVAGKLSEQELLARTDWDKVWGFDARDYLPLFHFARMNRLPMLAANVERSLPDAVAKAGWDGVPKAQKEGVSRPAAPSAAYLKDLRVAFDQHPNNKGASFAHFVEAQTVWDRAIAQSMAEYLKAHPGTLVVGILGAGHVRYGHGVAHQLHDLGITHVGDLLTWNHADACAHIAKGVADAVQIVEPPKRNPPRLGIATDGTKVGKEGVRIVSVLAGSVAQRAGLKAGDVLVEIAGLPVKDFMTVRTAVQRQAPGTWLPMKVRRGKAEVEIVAHFPAGT